jgi:hypothetical protein
MTDDRQRVPTEKAEDLAEQLCGLLAEQITHARQGNMVQVERLGARADMVLAQMASDQTGQPVMAESQRARLKRQYDELALTLRAEQGDVQTKLKQLRQVKRVVGAYNSKKRR